ncbi:MAG: chorismate mutase, partial [Bacteroidota bacterium]
DIPIMIKNPVNPDIKLWLGAIERFNAVGINRLVAIHRGFHYFEKTIFRNAPMWEIPIELKRIAPNLPVIVDSSHICGRRELIESISQKALDLDMDGLMIECHFDPQNALTDAAQQITPDTLKKLLDKLVIRDVRGDVDFQHKLEELRTEIDKLDGELLQILAKRMEIIDEIGEYKKDNDITILQMKRWAGIIKDRMSIGTNMGLDRIFMKKLLTLIHKESIQRQEAIFRKK